MEAQLTLDCDLFGFTAVQFGHALDLAESDIVAVLQTVPALIESRDRGLLVLIDVHNHALQGLLSVGVDTDELLAKVAEDGAKDTSGVGRDEVGAFGACHGVDLELLVERCVSQNHDLQANKN